MRGKLNFARYNVGIYGITPADAGKTLGRGAKPNAPAGSPPRMRGKPLTDGSDEYARRITPAGAGKTSLS